MSMTLAPANSTSSSASTPKSSAVAEGKKTGKPVAKSEYLPDSVIDSGTPTASKPGAVKVPVVNVFGEFNRTRKPSGLLAADLALKQHTFVESGFDSDVHVDPSGQWMAYASAREGETTQIYSRRVDSPASVQLTNGMADDAQPCISPDGKRIAFSSNRNGKWHVYLMNADGRNIMQITTGESNDMHPSFSPDGTRLIYSSLADAGGAGGQWQMCVIDLVSRQQKLIGPGLFPCWSPDKTRDVIAFQKTRARGSRWFSLWTCELSNAEADQAGQTDAGKVTEIAVSANSALVSPSWSPDGKHVAFVSIVEPAQIRNGKPQGQQDVWVVDADGTNRRRLTDGTATNLTPCWAVDNRVYFVSDRSGHESIWSLPGAIPAIPAIPPTNEVTASGRATIAPTTRSASSKESDSTTAANESAEVKP